MKVLIIAYYFPPLGWSGVQRTLKFVKYLRDFGWEPVVVTVGKTKFPIIDESLLKEVPKEIEVIRIDDIKFKDVTDEIKEKVREYTKTSFDIILDKNLKDEYEKEIEGVFEKLRSLFLLPDGNAIWANNVIKQIGKSIDLKDIDLVYTTSSPYSDHIIGYHIKINYDVPWIADFRDEWTNNAYLSLGDSNLRFKIERNMERNIVNTADKIITTTTLAKQNYLDIYSLDENKVLTITNGYDENDFKDIQVKGYNKKKKFKIMHNGSFYSTIDPYTLIKAVINLLDRGLIDENKIEVILIGENDKSIISNASNMVGKNKHLINFVGYLTHKESLKKSSEADMLLLVLGPNEKSKSVFPGKVFEYLRLKKPILALSPRGSVVEELLDETKAGVNIEYDDIEGIENAILKYYNDWKNEKEFEVNEDAIKKYERKNLTKKLSEIFNAISEKK